MTQSLTRQAELNLKSLTSDEQKLVERIRKEAHDFGWEQFSNETTESIFDFYLSKGMKRKEVTNTPIYEFASHLLGRKMIEAGVARENDYRDDITAVIRERYKTRKAFCDDVGIEPDMLSHVLCHRRHFSMDSLLKILDKLDLKLAIMPKNENSEESLTSDKQRKTVA